MMTVMRTTLADALHLSGSIEEAEHLFLEAEEIQKKEQPEFPYLYSLQGFQFCDLLLGKGAFAEALERAQKTLEWAKKGGLSLLTIALDHLTLGRARLKLALQKENATDKGNITAAGEFLDKAVAGLRKFEHQEFIVKGLLARAEFYRFTSQYEMARVDLNEALEIAQSGGMKRFLVDYFIEIGLLEKAMGKGKEAEEHFKIAGKLIDETGYERKRECLK